MTGLKGLHQHIVEIYFDGDQARMDRFLMSAEFNAKIDAIAEKYFSSGNVSIGETEIDHRFGFHKATIEGANATLPKHRALRLAFKAFAMLLDGILPPGRAKAVMFTELETASMWAHKAIAELAPALDETEEWLDNFDVDNVKVLKPGDPGFITFPQDEPKVSSLETLVDGYESALDKRERENPDYNKF